MNPQRNPQRTGYNLPQSALALLPGWRRPVKIIPDFDFTRTSA